MNEPRNSIPPEDGEETQAGPAGSGYCWRCGEYEVLEYLGAFCGKCYGQWRP
ncbi:MAG: hypothetical protein ACM3ML_00930 [Micromonosporaceae bacterium]